MAIDSISNSALKEIQFQKRHLSKNSIINTLDSIKDKLDIYGFINNSIDSLIDKNDVYTAYFNLKTKIKKIRIYFNEDQITKVKLSKISKQITSNYLEVKPSELSSTLQSITNTLEKKGNSFSEVKLKNISIKNDTVIESHLSIKKSALRKIDKIILNGYANFPNSFLNQELELKQNSLFSKQKLNNASKAIHTISFVSETKPAEVLFTKDSTIVYLNLQKENTNKFDGLIAFSSNEKGKGLSFNGYLDLSLNNLFNFGEDLNLIWKNNGNNRQVLNLDLSMPYIFNSKISPYIALNLYRQDSTFVNTLFKLSLPYKIDRRSSIGLSLQSENSTNLLTTLNDTIENYSNLFYGINYKYTIPLNHNLFSTKFNFNIEALRGTRNSTTKNQQTKLHLSTSFLFSFNSKNHLFTQNKSGLIDSEKLLSNELLRIGGSNSIRGFNEESILASSYSIFNVEYRYLTNKSSYLYSITDFGYINLNKKSSQLYAVGLGYAFTSKLGLINLSYALGIPSQALFNLNNSRFHIKIINFF